LFRTCKYRPEYPSNGFATLESAREWLARFVRWYRLVHRHSALRFVTPHQFHTGQATDILGKRHALYEAVKAMNPLRWT
jgi:putative transposase